MTHFIKTKYDLNSAELVSVIDELSLWAAPFGLRLLEMMKIRKNISVLDIGFGLGFPLLEIAMRLGDSCKVYGIDPWEAAVARVKSKIEMYGIKNVELITGFAENIPLPDKSIDLIISNNGINNVEDQEKVFSECRRISRPGSQLLFNFNLEDTMIEFYSVLKDILNESGMLNELEKMKQHVYSKRKPAEEVICLVEKNGFTINEVKHDSFQFRFTDGSSMFNHFLIKLAFLNSWQELVPETKQKEIFEETEKRLNSIAESEGELKLTVPFVSIDAVCL
jgi:ubiquinone/menaquinone biosynthesis C-methylase UbiE